MQKTGTWASGKKAHEAKKAAVSEPSIRSVFEVILPDRLPLRARETELHNVYSKVRKKSYVTAVSEKQAINNFFYRVLGSYAKLIYHTLKEEGKTLDARVYEIFDEHNSESELEHQNSMLGYPNRKASSPGISDEQYKLQFGNWAFH